MFVSLELFVFFSKCYLLNVRSCLIRKLPVSVFGCALKSSLSVGVKKKKGKERKKRSARRWWWWEGGRNGHLKELCEIAPAGPELN